MKTEKEELCNRKVKKEGTTEDVGRTMQRKGGRRKRRRRRRRRRRERERETETETETETERQ